MAKIISIDDAQEGQVLAETISNSFGQQLMHSGAVLEERHIHLLKRWNVRRIFIHSEESEADAELFEEDYNSAVEAIQKRLKWEPLLEIEIDLIRSAYSRKAKSSKNNATEEKEVKSEE